LAITLAVELRAADAHELARRFRLSDPRSARRAARRGRILVARSDPFADLRRRVLAHLDALDERIADAA
jgi:hypothetical protein